MAPEQAKGSQVDGRADQYSLAVVGHQVLTGKQPFEGSSHSILYKHVFEPPPRVFETRPDAPADLVAALDRALAKDPERRFATMEDFAAAVSGDRRSGSRTMVSTPGLRLARRGRLLFRLTRSRIVRRGLITLGICLVVGGAAWGSLREPAKATGLTPPTPAPAATPVSQNDSISPSNQPDSATTVRTQGTDSSVPPSPGIADVTPAAAKPKPAKKEDAHLTVASEPWAVLYIDDVEIGPTPVADHPLSPGRYRLRVEQEGYRSKLETIVVTGPNPIRRRYSLEPAGVD
jgi:serine/threonine-protein kinase